MKSPAVAADGIKFGLGVSFDDESASGGGDQIDEAWIGRC
jgi:hypothetical protein